MYIWALDLHTDNATSTITSEINFILQKCQKCWALPCSLQIKPAPICRPIYLTVSKFTSRLKSSEVDLGMCSDGLWEEVWISGRERGDWLMSGPDHGKPNNDGNKSGFVGATNLRRQVYLACSCFYSTQVSPIACQSISLDVWNCSMVWGSSEGRRGMNPVARRVVVNELSPTWDFAGDGIIWNTMILHVGSVSI